MWIHDSLKREYHSTGGKDYGYRCTLVDGACATRDLPMGDGSIDADQVHRIEMTILADNFAVCVPNVDALKR